MLYSQPIRLFGSSALLRQKPISKDNVQTQKTPATEAAESIKPESFHKNHFLKSDEGPKTDALLAEQTVSNKEQRKADWAILKEMAKYIWPKVSQYPLMRMTFWRILNKVGRMISEPNFELVLHLGC